MARGLAGEGTGGALGEASGRLARGGYRLAVSSRKPLDEAMQEESPGSSVTQPRVLRRSVLDRQVRRPSRPG